MKTQYTKNGFIKSNFQLAKDLDTNLANIKRGLCKWFEYPENDTTVKIIDRHSKLRKPGIVVYVGGKMQLTATYDRALDYAEFGLPNSKLKRPRFARITRNPDGTLVFGHRVSKQ